MKSGDVSRGAPDAGRPAHAAAPEAPPLENLGGEAPPLDAPDLSESPAPPAPESSAADLRDRWLRAEADLQNFRRRAARDRDESRRSAEDAMLREWIGVLDDLDRAIGAAPEGTPESWLAGLRMVGQRMLDLMARYGVRALDPAGEPFDPAFHEALAEIEGPEGAAPGTVVQVVQKGYARESRPLRPARVLVARGAVAADPR